MIPSWQGLARQPGRCCGVQTRGFNVTYRGITAACLLAGLLLPSTAFANAVLLQGDLGEVVPTHSQEIYTQVQAQVATTQVTTTFAPLTATSALFCFGVPEQAAAYELVLILDGVEQLADVAVGDDAEYPDQLGSNASAELATYVGDNPLRTWVRDIPAGAEVAFRLSYVELLPYSFGEVTYTFPLVPFIGDDAVVDELVFELDLSTERPVEDFTHNLTGGTLDTISDTHLLVSVTQQDASRNVDLVCTYRVEQSELGLRLWAYRPVDNPWVDEDDGYFLLLLEPPTESDEVSDKVFTYVLDRSGSMSGNKIVDARNAAQTAIDGLNPDDWFNVIAFDDMLEFFASSPVPATSANREAANSFVAAIDVDGATNIESAVTAALLEDASAADSQYVNGLGPGGCNGTASPGSITGVGIDGGDPPPSLPRVILFLTDGLPTAGITDPQTILHNIEATNKNAAAIYSVAIGNDADAGFLSALAKQNRGGMVAVGAGTDLQLALEELFFRINNPLLIWPELATEGGAPFDVLPEALPDLFLGNQLVIVGRYAQPGSFDVELSGELDGATTTYPYSGELPALAESQVFVARIWAVTMAQHLLSRIEVEGETDELVEQIMELGTAYGINTPYTKFSFAPDDTDDSDDDDAAAPADAGSSACACVLGEFMPRDPILPLLALGGLAWAVRSGRRRRERQL